MKKLSPAIIALSAILVLPSATSAQTVDISGWANQSSVNAGRVKNKGVISIDRKVSGTHSSATLSSVGATNDANIAYRSIGTAIAPPAQKTKSSYGIKQSAINGAAGKVTTSGRINAGAVRNGASVSMGAIGAANSLSTTVVRK